MRSSLRRADRCWKSLMERYSDILGTLSDEEFDEELRRLFTGFTREQFVAAMRRKDSTAGGDEQESSPEYLDRLFEGRKKL